MINVSEKLLHTHYEDTRGHGVDVGTIVEKLLLEVITKTKQHEWNKA